MWRYPIRRILAACVQDACAVVTSPRELLKLVARLAFEVLLMLSIATMKVPRSLATMELLRTASMVASYRCAHAHAHYNHARDVRTFVTVAKSVDAEMNICTGSSVTFCGTGMRPAEVRRISARIP